MIHTYWWWRWYKLSHAASRRIPRAPQQFNGMPVITSDAGADLSYAMLDGASLRDADLRGATLEGTAPDPALSQGAMRDP